MPRGKPIASNTARPSATAATIASSRRAKGRIRQGICTAFSGRVDTSTDAKIWESCQREIPCSGGECALANDTCKGLAWASCAVKRFMPELETDPRGLERSTIGSRTFVTERDLDPLMHSAEDFIEMWEKIEGTRARGGWD